MKCLLAAMVVIAVGTQLAASGGAGVPPIPGQGPALPTADAASSVPTVEDTDLPDLNTPQAAVTPWKLDAVFPLPEIPEPSGLCYCELTGTIFVVDDGGPERPSGLYEIDLDGNFLRGTQFGTDLEGVTYCGANGLLYICDEHEETVHIVEPKELQLLGSSRINRRAMTPSVYGNFGSEVLLLEAGGNGFEGIAWYPGMEGAGTLGYLLLLNQDDPACLLWVTVEDVVPGSTCSALQHYMLPQRNSGELYYDSKDRQLWVVNSWMNTTAILSIDVAPDVGAEWPVERWEVLPGMAQEGLTFDPQGRMWIGQDVGGVARYVKASE